MTTYSTRPTDGQHRGDTHDGDTHDARTRAVAHLTHPLDHSPEVLIALAAVLVVVAGPVMKALSPDSPLLSALSAALLLVGLVVAAVAGARLLRS